MVEKWFVKEHREIMQLLHDKPELQFKYLKSILMSIRRDTQEESDNNRQHSMSGYSRSMSNASHIHSSMSERNISMRPMVSSTLFEDLMNDKNTHEQFIKLLCKYAPSEVKEYLEQNEQIRIMTLRRFRFCTNSSNS
eukprot:UN23617